MLSLPAFTERNDSMQKRLIFSIGFAIFAMFFGAGNLVFPLAAGAHAGHHLPAAILGFLLTGVLVPLMGLFAIALYRGRYLDFLAPIGRVPAFIVAAFIIFMIGIVVGTPRTSVLAYATFKPFFAHAPQTSILFNAVFFILVFICSLHQYRIVDLMGCILSPMKLTVLILVIILGVFSVSHRLYVTATPGQVFTHAVESGYGTMDLLAGFFFCAFVYKVIFYKTRHMKNFTDRQRAMLTLKACLIGASILAVIYLGFMWVSNHQAALLQHVPTESMIGAVSRVVLPHFAAVFVAVCVTLACFSTALAVNAVTVEFIQEKCLRGRVPYVWVLAIVTFVVFVASCLGFTRLMAFAIPILSVIYPALIALTAFNLVYKFGLMKRAFVSGLAFYLVLVIALLSAF